MDLTRLKTLTEAKLDPWAARVQALQANVSNLAKYKNNPYLRHGREAAHSSIYQARKNLDFLEAQLKKERP